MSTIEATKTRTRQLIVTLPASTQDEAERMQTEIAATLDTMYADQEAGTNDPTVTPVPADDARAVLARVKTLHAAWVDLRNLAIGRDENTEDLDDILADLGDVLADAETGR